MSKKIKNKTNNYPMGWKIKKLGEVIKLEYGKPLEKSKRLPNAKYPVYGANGIKSYSNEYYYDRKTIIVGRKGSAGEINLTKAKFWPLDVSYFVVFDEQEIELIFLYFILITLNIPKLAKGVKPGINRNDVYNLDVVIPPLPEQKRIVAILDRAFSAIERSRNIAEQNLNNAKELFESYLNRIFEEKGEDWEEKTLGEVVQKTETINPKLNPEKEFIYIDVSSVNKETKIIENTTILFGKDAPSRARKLIKTNDVIFATVRPTHQRVAIISDNFNNQVCSTGYYVLRAKEFIHHKIIYYFILTYNFNEEMEKLQKGASYPAVTNKEVEARVINFPKSIQEQERIVAELDALQAETKKLEEIYQQKLESLEDMKKSVLQKAFRGELTEKEISV